MSIPMENSRWAWKIRDGRAALVALDGPRERTILAAGIACLVRDNPEANGRPIAIDPQSQEMRGVASTPESIGLLRAAASALKAVGGNLALVAQIESVLAFVERGTVLYHVDESQRRIER